VAHFDEDSGFVALDKPALFEFDLGTTRLNHASRTLIAFFATTPSNVTLLFPSPPVKNLPRSNGLLHRFGFGLRSRLHAP
jgi:hypothetical protein